MQVTGTSSGNQYTQASSTNNENKKTDEFLFEQNNLQNAQTVTIKADIANVSNATTTPVLIGALLSSFADDIINFLGGNPPDVAPESNNEDNPDERVTPTAGTTNYIA